MKIQAQAEFKATISFTREWNTSAPLAKVKDDAEKQARAMVNQNAIGLRERGINITGEPVIKIIIIEDI